MVEKLVDRVLRKLDDFLPTRIESCGSDLVDEVWCSQVDPDKDALVLHRGELGRRIFGQVPRGRYGIGQRVEIVRKRHLGPFEALGLSKDDSFGFNEYFIRPWDPGQCGKNLGETVDKVWNPKDCV